MVKLGLIFVVLAFMVFNCRCFSYNKIGMSFMIDHIIGQKNALNKDVVGSIVKQYFKMARMNKKLEEIGKKLQTLKKEHIKLTNFLRF